MKSVLFLLSFLFIFRPVMPVIDYWIDYDYIATVLCVNKDKPELQCNGKCHLMEELSKVNEEPSQTDKKMSVVAFSMVFFQDFSEVVISQVLKLASKKVLDFYENAYHKLLSFQFFRPPLVFN